MVSMEKTQPLKAPRKARQRLSFEAKLGASLERNPTQAPVALSAAEGRAQERQITRVFMEFLPGDEADVRRITKFLVHHDRLGVNRMRVVRLALRALAENPETLAAFDRVLLEDGRTKANRRKRATVTSTL